MACWAAATAGLLLESATCCMRRSSDSATNLWRCAMRLRGRSFLIVRWCCHTYSHTEQSHPERRLVLPLTCSPLAPPWHRFASLRWTSFSALASRACGPVYTSMDAAAACERCCCSCILPDARRAQPTSPPAVPLHRAVSHMTAPAGRRVWWRSLRRIDSAQRMVPLTSTPSV